MSEVQCKITDLVKNNGKISFSLEITPNIETDEFIKIEYDPLFYSITWHATQHECRNLDIAPLNLAKLLKRNNKVVLLHLSCNLLKKSYASELLQMLQSEGICNLLLVLGENYNADSSDFKSTQDLIHFIRYETGDYFCIGVVAFPDRDDSLKHLKEKVDSGADFIITQAVFDVNIFIEFMNKCEALNITIPIIPGLFCFESEKELTGFLNLCKVKVTEEFMEEVKNKSGIDIVSKLIDDIATYVNHFHLFTLNKIDRSLKLIRLIRKM